MKWIKLTISLVLIAYLTSAQGIYTQNFFTPVLAEQNVVYGVDTNYAGIPDTLRMDIYKPSNDQNCMRPLLILVHGGSWISGSKDDPNIVFIANEMARKGYVVAAINYRLGMHKSVSYSMYWACNTNISAPCIYVADSSEVVRAIFRGMQDTKSAIRFMKNRYQTDSTDVSNVYLMGESAGGFNVIAAAYMRDDSMKPADCFPIQDAPVPDSDLVTCNPAGFSLLRPDLGSIEGDLNTGLHTSEVKGVASIYGGMLNTSYISQSVSKPAIYLFHQGSDVVVHYVYDRLLGRINGECYAPSNVCQPYPHMPFAYGGEGIRRELDSMANPVPLFRAEIVYNYSYGNDCFANGHSVDNLSLRCLQAAELFSIVIDSSGNDPVNNCNLISVSELYRQAILISPNPARDKINLHYDFEILIEQVNLYDITGRKKTIVMQEEKELTIQPDITSGIYLLEVISNRGRIIKKLIVQK